jgi:hypothetical protein
MTELMKDLDEILHTDKEGKGTYHITCSVCGNIFFGDKHETICKRCILKSELNKRPPELQPVTVPAFLITQYNHLQIENITLKSRINDLEEQIKLERLARTTEQKNMEAGQ